MLSFHSVGTVCQFGALVQALTVVLLYFLAAEGTLLLANSSVLRTESLILRKLFVFY